MSEPTVTFAFNHDGIDTPWGYAGGNEEDPNQNGWMEISPATDLVVFTGGGILGLLPTPTCASGTRDATIRPSVSSYVIPQTYVEKDAMYNAPLTGHNANRYAMGVYIKGTMTSDLYLEAWDDNSFSTTNLEILTGTTNSSNNSFVNAIRTTLVEPPWGPGWSGSDTGAAFLRGVTNRVGLNNTSTITNSTVYYNIYIRLPVDCSTFHVFPVLGFRYLYT
jgi:hypothetical protein